jgi:hypothetical protein
MNIAPNILSIRDVSKKILRGEEFPNTDTDNNNIINEDSLEKMVSLRDVGFRIFKIIK